VDQFVMVSVTPCLICLYGNGLLLYVSVCLVFSLVLVNMLRLFGSLNQIRLEHLQGYPCADNNEQDQA
jgi:hypothetical protein